MALFIEAFPEHLRAIGVITVRWAAIDKTLHDILLNRFAMEEQAQKLRTLQAGRGRLEFFRKWLESTSIDEHMRSMMLSSVDTLLAKTEERNFIVHGQFGAMFDPDDTLRPTYSDIGLRTKDGLSEHRFAPQFVTVEDIMGHADEVYEASKALSSFCYHGSVTR